MVDLRFISCMLVSVKAGFIIFLSFLFATMFVASADIVNHNPFNPDIITADIGGVTYSINKDIVVAETGKLSADVLEITGSVIVENNGVIESDIKVCNGCQVIIKNSGQINSNFILGDFASVYQVVSTADEVGKIDFGVNYSVFVESNENVSLADVVDSANNADKIVVKNTRLTIDKLPNNKNTYIELGENVVFVVDDIDGIETETVLENIVNNGSVVFEYNNTNAMYSSLGYIRGGKLYIERTRDKDYADIITDKEHGDFIDSLPKDDNLLEKLNSAVDSNEINRIMSKSARFNRDVLRKPLQILTEMDLTDFGVDTGNKFVAVPFGVLADDFYVYGADIRVYGNVTERLNVGAGLRIAKMVYASSYDDFDGLVYGLNLKANYMLSDNMFVRSFAGVAHADFDIDTVFYDGKFINTPSALFGYFGVDAGYKFMFENNFYVTPFFGAVAQYYNLEDDALIESVGRVGTSFEYKYELSGMVYKYGVDLLLNTDAAAAATAKIEFLSTIDSIAGDLSAPILRAVDTWSYKSAISMKILF